MDYDIRTMGNSLYRHLKIFLFAALVVSCKTNIGKSVHTANPDFAPPPGYRYLFIHAESLSISGTEDDQKGFTDLVALPAGLSFELTLEDMQGIENIEQTLSEPAFSQLMVHIKLLLPGNTDDLLQSSLDDKIYSLGETIRRTDRPVFLELHYFETESLSHESSINTFRHISQKLNNKGTKNLMMLWSPPRKGIDLQLWYPGDDYADWMAWTVSIEDPEVYIDWEFREFAKSRSKAVFLTAHLHSEDRTVLFKRTGMIHFVALQKIRMT